MKKYFLALFAVVLAASPLWAETAPVQAAYAEAKTSPAPALKKNQKNHRALRKKKTHRHAPAHKSQPRHGLVQKK